MGIIFIFLGPIYFLFSPTTAVGEYMGLNFIFLGPIFF